MAYSSLTTAHKVAPNSCPENNQGNFFFFNRKADVPNTQQTASFIAYPQQWATFIDISFFSIYDTEVKTYCRLQENLK